MRVPVLSVDGTPVIPTKPSRARRWLKSALAKVVRNDLNVLCVELTKPSESNTQPIAFGIDPGKLYTGIGVQSAKVILFTAHLMLAFKTVRERMEQRQLKRKYGGTTTRHSFRKGDYVRTEQAGRTYYGWVCADTERQVSVSNANWKRLGQSTASSVRLIQRSTDGLAGDVIPQGRFTAGENPPAFPPHPAALSGGISNARYLDENASVIDASDRSMAANTKAS